MKKTLDLSVVVPAYNEEKILKNTLETLISFLEKTNYSWEIVVADDGSLDSTYSIAKSFPKNKIKAVKLTSNKGKGAALKAGVEKAHGEYIIFTDADLSVPLNFTDDLVKTLQVSSVAIGSRRTKGAKIEVHQPLLRESLGRIYTFITRLITSVPVSDFTCGFKGFQKKAGKKIFKSSKIDRWGYDAEILFLAKKFGYSISEVPVSWKNREDTRVRLGAAMITSLRDLVKIRFLDLTGAYD